MSRGHLEASMRRFPRSPRPAATVSEAALTSTDPKRRRFLLTLGVGGAGAAAAGLAALPAVAAGEGATTESDSDGKYRETAHVRDYYRTAKL
jgi:hypothetical protein